ncbi:MAG TPA: HlyC/CorC family transporter [candidate division WOR-3 bacterium]|uniref:HlyC/CorC family transporter n=1 Tax=candidate division WOR-3 bacterium TaxID=2052148 RepID=A0A7V0T401_UNCW3|nr:HlyC/CorC family transporter [candidate division WOR-3 bacterium]
MIAFYLVAVGCLLVLSALSSGSETALFSLTPARREELRERHPRAARRIDRLLREPARLLGTILVFNLLVNVGASALFTLAVMSWVRATGRSPALYLGAAGFVMTGLLLVFGEVTPKSAATHFPVSFARLAAPFISLTRVLFAPVSFLLVRLGTALAPRRREDEHLSEDELHTMVRVGRERGTISEREEEILWNLIEFGDRTVSEVMTPRIDIVGVEKATRVADAVAACREHGRSRLPVYDGTIDHVVGAVYAKELLVTAPDRAVAELMREVPFVPEVKRLASLLDELRKKGCHIAVVVDEFGQTAGLVTLEDALEAIFGEIADEYDEPGELPWRRVAVDAYEVEGEIDIVTLNRLFRGRFDEVEHERLAGLVQDRLGRLPVEGDVVRFAGLEIEVLEVSENKLERAVLRRGRGGRH